MSKPTKHKHIIVIGRVSDKENDFISFNDMTANQAANKFEKMLKKNSGYSAADWKLYGKEAYIDAILTSETPIYVDWRS